MVSSPCPGAAAGSAPVVGVNLLASDPLALAAGGTSLQASHTTGAYIGETAWNSPPHPPARPGSSASGGGFSKVFRRPAYQDGVPGIGAFRGVPDVAADAAANTGMTLATTDGGQNYVLVSANGTSAAAPLLGRGDRASGPVRGPPSGLRQPRPLPDRPQFSLPPGIPRGHHGHQHGGVPGSDLYRVPGRARVESGHRLGQPERPGARPPARSLRG